MGNSKADVWYFDGFRKASKISDVQQPKQGMKHQRHGFNQQKYEFTNIWVNYNNSLT